MNWLWLTIDYLNFIIKNAPGFAWTLWDDAYHADITIYHNHDVIVFQRAAILQSFPRVNMGLMR